MSPAGHEPVYRRNFFFFLTDGILFLTAKQIIGPTTLIPDFVRHLTSSEILIGLSSSLFDVGWTLPQLFIARAVVRFEHKKWWVVVPNIPVRLVMLIFAILTILLGRDRPEAILCAFLVCYGISAVGDGIVTVPWWILAGTSLDNRWRVRALGLQSAIAGVLMLALSPLIGIVLSSTGLAFPDNYALIFGVAGVLFALSILPLIFVHELTGGTAAEKIPSLREFLPGLGQVLRADGPFRTMIVIRLLTTLFAMANPFYIGFATVRLGLSSTTALPVLLAMQTIGGIIGALLYSWLGARGTLSYIRLALVLAAVLPVSALLATVTGPLLLCLGFFVSGLTVGNLFFSYQNWLISYAAPEQRALYTGLFNTVAAVASMIAPFIAGTIAQHAGYESLFALALVMLLSAFIVSLWGLPEARPHSPQIAAAD